MMHLHTPEWVHHLHLPHWDEVRERTGRMCHDDRFWLAVIGVALIALLIYLGITGASGPVLNPDQAIPVYDPLLW